MTKKTKLIFAQLNIIPLVDMPREEKKKKKKKVIVKLFESHGL